MCFLVGRSSKFLQLSAGIQSCRGNLFNFNRNYYCLSSLLFSNGSELLLSFGHYCEYCVLCDEEFFLFSLFFCSSVSGIRSVFINWVCWVPGNFSGEPGHVYFVCVSPLCGVACRYNFNWALRWCGRRDCTDFFLAFWLCSGGYGTVELVRGVVRFSFAFFSLLSVLLAVGCLRYEIFVLYIFCW